MHTPLYGPKFSQFHAVFSQNLAKSYVGAPLPRAGAPYYGKSWIRPWNDWFSGVHCESLKRCACVCVCKCVCVSVCVSVSVVVCHETVLKCYIKLYVLKVLQYGIQRPGMGDEKDDIYAAALWLIFTVPGMGGSCYLPLWIHYCCVSHCKRYGLSAQDLWENSTDFYPLGVIQTLLIRCTRYSAFHSSCGEVWLGLLPFRW